MEAPSFHIHYASPATPLISPLKRYILTVQNVSISFRKHRTRDPNSLMENPRATLIPPACGLGGINLHTWTGRGSIRYWSAFVAVLAMHDHAAIFVLPD